MVLSFYKHKVMVKKPPSVNRDIRVKDIYERLRSELLGEKSKKPELDVPTTPDSSADLRIRKLERFWQDYWDNVWKSSGLCVKNNVIFTREGLRMLCRSWFKEAMTEEERRASMYMPKKEEKKEDDADRVIAKELLHQFLKQAKARNSSARKKGKKVDEKQISSTSAPAEE